MATSAAKGIEVVGTEAAPVVIANGATETYTHNNGIKPQKVEVIDAVNKGFLGTIGTGVAVVCADGNTIALTNNGAAPVNLIVRITWTDDSTQLRAPTAQTVFA